MVTFQPGPRSYFSIAMIPISSCCLIFCQVFWCWKILQNQIPQIWWLHDVTVKCPWTWWQFPNLFMAKNGSSPIFPWWPPSQSCSAPLSPAPANRCGAHRCCACKRNIGRANTQIPYGSMKPYRESPLVDGYPLVIQQCCGKSPGLLGNFTINGHFPWLCEITRG